MRADRDQGSMSSSLFFLGGGNSQKCTQTNKADPKRFDSDPSFDFYSDPDQNLVMFGSQSFCI